MISFKKYLGLAAELINSVSLSSLRPLYLTIPAIETVVALTHLILKSLSFVNGLNSSQFLHNVKKVLVLDCL